MWMAISSAEKMDGGPAPTLLASVRLGTPVGPHMRRPARMRSRQHLAASFRCGSPRNHLDTDMDTGPKWRPALLG
jgi:hypothetical protein